MSIKVTSSEKTILATKFMDDISSGNSNVYIGIGHNTTWDQNDAFIDEIVETTDYLNQVHRNIVALKRIGVSDLSLVARRKDWSNNTTYDAYANNIEMLSYLKRTPANGTVTTSTVQPYYIEGTNTTFFTDFTAGNIMRLEGDGVTIPPVEKEIVTIISDNLMYANSDLTQDYEANTPILVSNSYPDFATNFYVRNIFDQVFVCLSNNSGTASNTMPQITIGGQLPTDPYIITADGYRWKYLYTIPGGLKQKYFSDQWMPIYSDDEVTDSVVDGRLDIVNIVNSGSGYNDSSASFSAPILTVVGDGIGANLTAQVDDTGAIVGVNILDAGSGYTRAEVQITEGVTGNGAILQPIIGPPGGWGSNVAMELGATTVMVSCEFSDTENETLPTTDAIGDFFTYRQISMLHNPLLANGTYANGTNYELATQVSISSNLPFAMGDTVYQSNTGLISNAFFTASVVYFDNDINVLHINNLDGNLLTQAQMYATANANTLPYGTTTVFSENDLELKPFSGTIKYINNRLPVSRFPGQSESIRFTVEF